MLLQDKNKKGVSEMVGYVLLVVFAVIIGAIVFTWLKTYVPAEALNCPDGVSIFIDGATFDSSNSQLELTLKNNGRFDIAGYFIHATNSSAQELPTIDLSPYLNESFGGKKFGNSVIIGQGENLSFGKEGNLFKTGDMKSNTFDIPPEIGELYSIRIVPTRFQEENKRQRFVSCSDAKVQQLIGEQCVPDCTGKVCGSDGCGGSCGSCSSGFFCDAIGQCISTSCIPVSNPCGIRVCGTATNGTCGQVNCGTCNSGFTCNVTVGQCISDCGNGIINAGEGCDDGDTTSGDGCSSTCTVENYYSCVGQPSVCTVNVASCPSYCVYLGYSTGFCTNSEGNCAQSGGVYKSGGNQWCTGGAQADTCCCAP